MHSPSSETIENLLQEHVLHLFSLPKGIIVWQGDSVLDTESLVYYFCINENNYLLVNESFHGVSDSALENSIIGNAVAPHQKIALIHPKDGSHTYTTLTDEKRELSPRLTGDFSLFRILE